MIRWAAAGAILLAAASIAYATTITNSTTAVINGVLSDVTTTITITPVSSNLRVTSTGDFRVTSAGDNRAVSP